MSKRLVAWLYYNFIHGKTTIINVIYALKIFDELRKVEFIVMGGTFMALDEEYRDYFIRNLHDALSGHTSNDVAEAVKYVEHLYRS